MRKLDDKKRHSSTGSCVLWREDVLALTTLLRQHSKRFSIVCKPYEYDSVEELFASFGPQIPKLRLEGDDLSITIELDSSGSNFWVHDRRAPDNAYPEIGDFFRERRSLRLAVFNRLFVLAIPLVLGIIFLESQSLLANGIVRSAVGFLLIPLMMFCLIGAVIYSFAGNYVVIRNQLKTASQFSARERWIANRDRVVFAIIGGALTLVGQWIFEWLRK